MSYIRTLSLTKEHDDFIAKYQISLTLLVREVLNKEIKEIKKNPKS